MVTLKASYFTAEVFAQSHTALYYDNVIWMFQNPPAPTPLARANSKLTDIYYNISHSGNQDRCYKIFWQFKRVGSKESTVIIFYELCV